MVNRCRVVAGFVLGLALAGWAGGAAPPKSAAASNQCENQAPRALAGVAPDGHSPVSKVKNVTPDSLTYEGHGLRLCSVHYHCTIETFQGCVGQSVSPEPGPEHCPRPSADSWIEVHRAYSLNPTCVGTVKDCCTTGPFVVLGYHAKIVSGTSPAPLPLFRESDFDEFSGSTTGPGSAEGGDRCKPAAFWSFSRGCHFQVHANQLAPEGEGARPLQFEVSHDLTWVRPVH
jgi:hypothetical protein